jgi:hypothetical protein
MSPSEARKLFVEKYSSFGCELLDKADEDLEIRLGGRSIKIEDGDLVGYAERSAVFGDHEAAPCQTSICSSKYREQLIGTSTSILRAAVGLDRTEIIMGPAEGTHLIVSRPSPLFLDFHRFSPEFLTWWHEDVSRRARILDNRTLKSLMPRMLTVKVFNINASSIAEAVKVSSPIIDAGLFKIAATRRRALNVREAWLDRRRATLSMEEQSESGEPLPKVAPINDLVKLYVLAVGTSYAPLRFLALYQILEYFFLKTSDEKLYSRLKSRIGSLAFACEATHFDRLIQDVLDHRRENDEKEMLKLVIEKYVDEDELIEFINSYEASLPKEKPLTSKQKVFGSEVQASPAKGHVFGTSAKSIKVIRNALVHSSDRHERQDRYIPFSPATKTVEDYIPLMDFLAQKVMIATGQSI